MCLRFTCFTCFVLSKSTDIGSAARVLTEVHGAIFRTGDGMRRNDLGIGSKEWHCAMTAGVEKSNAEMYKSGCRSGLETQMELDHQFH